MQMAIKFKGERYIESKCNVILWSQVTGKCNPESRKEIDGDAVSFPHPAIFTV